MAKPPYLEEDYMKHYKAKDHIHAHKSNSYLSFFASLFFLFIYISIFYIFNLSPYTLFNSNIFWFFMSNTLILIIAADYGAFSSSSSSKQKHDHLYEEYDKHSHARNHVNTSSCVSKYQQQVDKQGIKLSHGKKETLTDDQNSENIIPERVLEIVAQDEPKKPSEYCSNEKKQKPAVFLLKADDDDGYKEYFDEEEADPPARINYRRRSKSDRFHGGKGVDERMKKKKTVRRSETMKKKVEEENEFSKMTNEDLNRRVEEFIQKFNRQIRLQASRN